MTPTPKTVHELIADLFGHRVFRRDALIDMGMSTHQLTAAVREGKLLRVRRGVYARPGTPAQILMAVRVGGRLTCLSMLHMIGIFVHSHARLHVKVPSDLSRSQRRRPQGARLHWGACVDEDLEHVVSVREAVRQSVLCQAPRSTIATLDSVLHHGVLTRDALADLFVELPLRYHRLLALVDGSSESGPETYMRLVLRSLGVQFETQVQIPGVGRVDFVVEGWLIIECDSRQFHEGWDKQVEDRSRDIAAARLGYVTIRPLAAALLGDRSQVRADVQAVVAARSTALARRAAPQLRTSARESASSRRFSTSLL